MSLGFIRGGGGFCGLSGGDSGLLVGFEASEGVSRGWWRCLGVFKRGLTRLNGGYFEILYILLHKRTIRIVIR